MRVFAAVAFLAIAAGFVGTFAAYFRPGDEPRLSYVKSMRLTPGQAVRLGKSGVALTSQGSEADLTVARASASGEAAALAFASAAAIAAQGDIYPGEKEIRSICDPVLADAGKRIDQPLQGSTDLSVCARTKRGDIALIRISSGQVTDTPPYVTISFDLDMTVFD